jgi:hypothetical protein
MMTTPNVERILLFPGNGIRDFKRMEPQELVVKSEDPGCLWFQVITHLSDSYLVVDYVWSGDYLVERTCHEVRPEEAQNE